MIVRIVRMSFRREALPAFEALFDRSAPSIRAFPGCRHLELWQDVDDPLVRTTYSLWESASALAAYRTSALFRDTWGKAKTGFAAPATASSHVVIGECQPSGKSENRHRTGRPT